MMAIRNLSPETQKMTAAQFHELPESSLPTELLEGIVFVSPSSAGSHQRIVRITYDLLKAKIPNGELWLSPMDVEFDESNVVQPDLFWVAANSQCVLVEDKFLRGAPDLIVEILSPGTTRRDKRSKFRLYERYGVREYWMINPIEQWIEVWTHDGTRFNLLDVYGPEDTFASSLIGEVKVAEIFPE